MTEDTTDKCLPYGELCKSHMNNFLIILCAIKKNKRWRHHIGHS